MSSFLQREKREIKSMFPHWLNMLVYIHESTPCKRKQECLHFYLVPSFKQKAASFTSLFQKLGPIWPRLGEVSVDTKAAPATLCSQATEHQAHHFHISKGSRNTHKLLSPKGEKQSTNPWICSLMITLVSIKLGLPGPPDKELVGWERKGRGL